MEIQIDISQDEFEDVTVENAELSYIRLNAGGIQVELSWEQAESLYRNLRGFFDDQPTPSKEG